MGHLTSDFMGRSRGTDKLATVGNKTWWRQPTCAAPGVDPVELVVKMSVVERVQGLGLLT
jgi:hypothetical protein